MYIDTYKYDSTIMTMYLTTDLSAIAIIRDDVEFFDVFYNKKGD
jgi:hypothetical protein